jgi:spore coat protein U-like protein
MVNRLQFRREAARLMAALALCLTISQTHVAHSATPATVNTVVTATVVANCTISSLPIAFGNYDPVAVNASTALQSAGSVTIACTRGSSPTIGIGLGGNAVGSVRRMTDGADFLAYEIFHPSTNAPGAACAYTTVWGNSGAALFTPTSPANKAARTYSLCGQVAGGQDVPVGSFADSVLVSVNF